MSDRILIVDDEPRVRKFLQTLIIQNGYDALVASDAKKALKVTEQNDIDLVISDIKMPGLSGIDLLKRIKTNWNDIEFIMITGYQNASTAKEALRWGAYDYISKPIGDIDKFMNIINNALTGRRLRQEKEELLKNLEQKNAQLEKTVDKLNQKRQSLDSMVNDLDITLEVVQKISTFMAGQSSLDSLTPDMYKLFGCSAWGMMNVNQEFESFTGDLSIFLRDDLSEDKIAEIKENIEESYREYGELTSVSLSISSKNIIEKARNYEHDCQMNLPMISQNNVYGIAFIYSVGMEKFPEKKLHLFSIIVRQLATLRDATLLDKVKKLSITDELTGLYNRRGTNEELKQQFYRYLRYGSNFTFGILDIDDFKKVNDTYGHPAGDRVLKQLTDMMKRYSRQSDIMGRYGGEEFAFILSNTDLKGAYTFSEKLRKKIAESEFKVKSDKKENITISIGVTDLDSNSKIDDIEKLINHADEALYDAKNSGKNRTCVYKKSR